ncbi:MAG: hypothetical protein R3E95_19495 [Thiolinea sp.]
MQWQDLGWLNVLPRTKLTTPESVRPKNYASQFKIQRNPVEGAGCCPEPLSFERHRAFTGNRCGEWWRTADHFTRGGRHQQARPRADQYPAYYTPVLWLSSKRVWDKLGDEGQQQLTDSIEPSADINAAVVEAIKFFETKHAEEAALSLS